MPTPTPTRRLALAVALVLALAAPASADAGTGGLAPGGAGASGAEAHANIRHSPGESAEFKVAATNGYTLEVKSEKGLLTLIASRQRPSAPTISPSGRLLPGNAGDVTESVYSVRGTPRDPSVIRADLGPLGSIAVAFHPSGKERVTNVALEGKSESCTGAAKVVRHLGAFTGAISFHAENGYTSAELGSAPGTLGTSAFRNCTTLPSSHDRRASLGRPAPGPPGAALSLQGGSGASSFLAFVDPDGSNFHATQAERLGEGLLVLRRGQATAPRSAFGFDPGLTDAALRPPAPFLGRGAYAGRPGAPVSWTGDLGVQFPGLRLPLTGPAFEPPHLRAYSPDLTGAAR